MKKILTFVCLVAFVFVLGCNDTKPTSAPKAGTPAPAPAGDKKPS